MCKPPEWLVQANELATKLIELPPNGSWTSDECDTLGELADVLETALNSYTESPCTQ